VQNQAPIPPPPTGQPDGPPPPPLPPYSPRHPYAGGAIAYRPGPAPGLRYAGFWIRFAAYVIDALPLSLLAALVKVSVVVTTCTSGGSGVSICTSRVDGPGATIVTAVLGVYWIVTWSQLGGSLGQRALGLRVVSADDGGNIGVGRAVLRFAGYLVSAIPFAIGLMWAGFDPRKQGWHDKIAGTFVVRPA
jgi:uncharacterized RDD family membrane protein YckC